MTDALHQGKTVGVRDGLSQQHVEKVPNLYLTFVLINFRSTFRNLVHLNDAVSIECFDMCSVLIYPGIVTTANQARLPIVTSPYISRDHTVFVVQSMASKTCTGGELIRLVIVGKITKAKVGGNGPEVQQ
ncbi:hypothetical protein DBV05_g3404 [Lasiodiplodia theobromae]|uniref:Uncharacterized protein n=1 Tax=Lasiodiplodia theobromae TaxID=45133 RepID=A0A5N5DJF1_9PEZI|nr:hypothetical protein DBV05_g3404 [Lasiodiplodia theobromae]